MSDKQSVTMEAEVVEPLDREAAERLDKRVRLLVGNIHDSMAKLHDLLLEAKRGHVHMALGLPSWTAYVANVFTVEVRLEPQQRRELVGWLSGEGMSQRAIADTLGTSKTTVHDDLQAGGQNRPPEPTTGLDGKTYKRKPKPTDKRPGDLTPEEAREVTDRIREWVDAQPDRDEAVRLVRELGPPLSKPSSTFQIPDNNEGAARELERLDGERRGWPR
jgi:transposase